MKFMKQAFGEVHKFHLKLPRRSYDPLKWDFTTFKMNIITIRKSIVDQLLSMTLHVHKKVLLQLWSYNIYHMMFSLNNSDVMRYVFTGYSAIRQDFPLSRISPM